MLYLSGNFKLKGDSITVPSISLDEEQIDVVFKVTIVLTFDVQSKKWVQPHEEEFKLDIVDFTGPFGLSRNVVSAVLRIGVPILRDHVMKMLPPELGMFVAHFQFH